MLLFNTEIFIKKFGKIKKMFIISRFQIGLFLSIFTFIFSTSYAICSEKSKKQTNSIWIFVGEKKIRVEVFDDDKERKRGLMFRKSLKKNEGALFIFEKEGYYSFWMRNTSIPLSIAFINKDKEIIGIQNMRPFDDRNLHTPKRPILYALEMNRNWFKRNKIKIGDKISIGGFAP